VTAEVKAYDSPPEYQWFSGYKLSAATGEIKSGTEVRIFDKRAIGYPWYKEDWYLVEVTKTGKVAWIFGGTSKDSAVTIMVPQKGELKVMPPRKDELWPKVKESVEDVIKKNSSGACRLWACVWQLGFSR